MTFNENLRYDLLVDDCLLIEAKSCEKEYMDLWRMQLLTYMKLMDKPLGLVINFGNEHLPKLRGVFHSPPMREIINACCHPCLRTGISQRGPECR